MTSALIEVFAAAWDTLFNKHPRLGSALKIVLICVAGCFAYYGFQTQFDYALQSDKQQDANFETIANQNKQLLNILEAQNALFSDRIETLEHRQYELQRDIVALIKENRAVQLRSSLPIVENNPALSVVVPEPVAPSNAAVEVRSAEIVESINLLKSQMTSEPTDVKPSDDEQTQQPAGN